MKQVNLSSFRDLPITQKLTLFCVMVILISLSLSISAIIAYDRYNVSNIVENDLKVVAKIISDQSHAAIVFNDPELAKANLAVLDLQRAVIGACIYTVGQPLATGKISRLSAYPQPSTPCPSYTPKQSLSITSSDAQFLELIEPVILDDIIIGYVYLKTDISILQERQGLPLHLIVAVSLFAALIVILLTSRFVRWLSSPLYHLGKTARIIAEHDNYSYRAEKYSNDEIGYVVDSFNQMLDVIEREDAQLRESEEKFRMISASSKVGIFQLDLDGNCIYANEELASITGLSISQIMADNWLSCIHPDDRPVVDSKWHGMLQNNQSINLSCRLQNNGIKWISGHVGLLQRYDDYPIGYLGTISDISDIKNAQIQLEQMAFYDTLTGLANRRLFRNRLEHVINNLGRERSTLGLILLDLDHFKHINDSLGHDSGDALLTIIAERLQLCVRASDTVARLGGDEFAILLPGINTSLAVSNVSQKILQTLKKPIILRETEIRITTSAGIAMAPDDSNEAEELIKNADLALYRAKDHGRDNYQFFTAEMNTRLLNHLRMVEDLREAVNNEAFSLVFQPQIDLKKGTLVGFEALIRWQHKTRGFISPMEFIPAAEETGLIIPIGRWVITAACQQIHTLRQQGIINESVAITVNLSVQQFKDEELVDFIASQIEQYHIQPAQLEVELTETVLMENLNDVLEILEALKKLGLLISIDDFGTGYSSLGYLKRLPVNIVKVDRSFVMDIPEDKDDMAITAAVIAMAHKLNYLVVAEGVETEEQLQFLEECDCDYGQGYYFSHPLPAEELAQFCQQFSLADLRANQNLKQP